MVQAISGTVAGKRQWTAKLHSIMIDAAQPAFQAGQFGRIGLMIDGEKVMRPYSFVNKPGSAPHEFYYIVVPEGPLTARLPQLAVGDEILINDKANGYLVLSEVPDAQQLWMLSTGTALGPFLSILKTEEPWRRFSDIVLAHAVREASELTYRDHIDALLEKGGGRLRYVPFVSREDTDFAIKGRVPAALQSGSLAARVGLQPTPETAQFMLCGNPNMVTDTTNALMEMGFAKNRRRAPGHITVENYW